MATTRPFAYNTGSTIDGTTQLGNLSIGVSDQDYSQNPGGVKWWMGPDEELGYVIAHEVSPCDQPTPIEVDACLGFWRSDVLTEQSFVDLFNVIPPRIGQTPFTNGNNAKTWLNDNGYWTSYDNNLPTPTSTSVLPTATPTPTPSNIPSGTPTPTPTETDIPSTPTPTPSPTEIPPTGTPEPTATEVLPTETPTNTPTNTPTPTATPVSATPTPTPTATTPSCDITYNIIDVTPTPTATLPACDVTYNIVDTTPTPTPTPSPTSTPVPPTATPTPTPTYYYYFLLNCDLDTNAYGRSLDPDINLSGFTFNVDTNICYTIIGQETDPYYDYDLDNATLVTDCTNVLCGLPTPTPTPTEVPPTPTPTSTDVPSTPTPTATEVPPTPTPTDVNLCNGIPYTLSSTYAAPGSGVTVWASNSTPLVASNLVNTLGVLNPFFFNRYDSNGVDRLSYFGNGISSSFTLTICQNNNSAIYTGTSSAMTYNGGGNSFRVSAIDLTLTQSSPLSAFTFNELVYIELSSYNGQPTPTATEATPTNTPTPTPTPTSTDVPSTPTPTATEVPPTSTPVPSTSTPTPTSTDVPSTPTPTATEVPPTNTPTNTPTPTPTSTDVPSTPTPTSTEVPPTSTPTPTPTPTSTEVPPTGTPTPTPTPTATDIPPTNTPSPTPTPTSTPVPPTNTPSPTPTPTSTPVPPTGTPVPTATPTSTPVPPTGTPVPTATPTSTPVPTSTPTPTPTATPNQTPNWINSGSYNCYSTCNKYNVEIDNNVNSLSYNTTRQGSLVESNSTSCGGCCGQSTAANWTNEGAAYCESCVSKQLQRDTNSCSGTYNQTRVIDSGSACDTSQSWVNSGSYNCYSTCNKYNVEVQNNPCATGYNTTRQGSLVESNSTSCGGCCGQSTTADWQWNGEYVCVGYTKYQQETDYNSCSPTYSQTRTGTFVESNSTFCGYTPPPTSTPVPAPTATPAPFYYTYEIGVDEPSRTTACNNFESAPRTEAFAVEGNPAYVLEFFTDFNLTIPFFGSSDAYCYARQDNLLNKYTTNINSLGQSTTSRDQC